MNRRSIRIRPRAIVRLCLYGIAVAMSLGLAGCQFLEPDEGFKPDATFDTPGEYRTKDPHNEFWGASNKARQIEQDCGVGG